MAKKARFNIMEALDKWEEGWCWNVVGDRFGYSGRTIKKYVKLTFENLDNSRKKHEKKHQKHCPKCNPVLKGEQQELFEEKRVRLSL